MARKGFTCRKPPGGAVLEAFDPYAVFAFLEEGSPGSILSNPAPTLTPPGLDPIELEPEDGSWGLDLQVPDRATLDLMAPNGVYTIAFMGATAGPVSGNLNLTGDAYPNAPTLTEASFNFLQSGNLATGFTLEWAPFQGGTVDDLIIVFIEEFNAQDGSAAFETEPFDLNGTDTSVPVPAGILSDEGRFEVCICFLKVVDTATIGGADAFGLYGSDTCLDVGDTNEADAFDGTDIQGAPGWKSSPWYSAYNVDFWPWIFHAEHGWQYIFETEVHGEVFIYDLESQAYWWASSAFEPLTFFSFDRGSFNFYFGGTTGPRQFVDLLTGDFWSIP